jgi:hypothetical protein
VLVGYFDESGHSSSTEFFALAAFVSDHLEWEQFDKQWRKALERNGAPYLHMREFAHFRGPFTGWTEERRRSLLGECVTAINSINAIAVGAAMLVEDFNTLDHKGQSRLQDPFFCCFQEVVRGVALNATFKHKGYKAHMVFSQQDQFRPKAMKLWNAIVYDSDVRARMGSLKFRNMRDVPALQAADLLAYEFRHFYHLLKTKPGNPPRWAFREIVLHQRNAHEAFMLKYLPSWYLQAQASGTLEETMIQKSKDPNNFIAQLSEMTPNVS